MKTKIVPIAVALMLIFATFGTGLAMAEEDKKKVRAKIKEKKLLHLYDVFFYQMERHRIGMEAIIAYVDESGDTNAGSAELVVIKDDFVALVGELETAADSGDAKEFKSMLKDARKLVKDFKEESHEVLGSEGAIGEARTKVNEALDENEEYLKTLRENIQQSRKESELEIVDEINDKIGEKVEELKEEGLDTEELDEKLAEIEEKRNELEEKLDAAIASCEGVVLAECETTEAEEYRDLRKELKEDYKDLREKSRKPVRAKKILKTVAKSRKVLEKVEERIAKAEGEGADVTVAKAKLEEVKAMLDEAEAKSAEGEYDMTVEKLGNAKGAFKVAQKEYLERKKEALEKAKERREEAVEKTKERREEAIDKAKERKEEAIDKAKERREEAVDKAKERREEAIDKAKERREEFLEDRNALKDEEQS